MLCIVLRKIDKQKDKKCKNILRRCKVLVTEYQKLFGGGRGAKNAVTMVTT